MKNFELLHEYIEGSLAQESEQELFALLKNSEELRIEFRQLLTINSTLKNNRNIFPVRDNSKAAIFSAIGLDMPKDPMYFNNSNPGNRFSGLFSKYYQNIITGLISASAACIVMYFLMSGVSANDKHLSKSNNSTPSTTATNQQIKAQESLNSGYNRTITKTIIRYVYIDTSKNESTILQENNNSLDLSGSVIPKTEYKFIRPDVNLSSNFPISSIKNNMVPVNFNDETKNSGVRHGLSFEVKGSEYRMLPLPTVSPYKTPLFNNTSLTLLYSLDNNWSTGFDLRQENFFQKFNGYDKIGSLNTYEQQPNFTTFSGVVRYKIGNYWGFVPYSQLSVGVNENGIVPRALVGLEYILLKEFSLIVSLEYSRMYFGYQNSNYDSQKIGLNYGISYNF